MATLRSHSVRFYAVSMGTTFALCGTAVYGGERLVSWLAPEALAGGRTDESGNVVGNIRTHAAGGVIGGAGLGAIFRRAPWGAVPAGALFGLIGAGVGVLEGEFQSYAEEQRGIRVEENKRVDETRRADESKKANESKRVG